ncbi:MAG: roadblock/LC7 domain-containing protein [Anaerolineae bacterium]
MAQVHRTDLLEEVLAELCGSLENVTGAVIVSIEGFVVAAYSASEFEYDEEGPTSSPQVAAMAATLIALGERTLARLAQGELSRLLIEGSSGGMLVVPASKRAAVALMMSKGARIGLAFYSLQRSANKIAEILEGR